MLLQMTSNANDIKITLDVSHMSPIQQMLRICNHVAVIQNVFSEIVAHAKIVAHAETVAHAEIVGHPKG